MARRNRHCGLALIIMAATVPPMVAAQAAQAGPPAYGSVVNSTEGFIGCLSTGTWSQPTFTIHCLAMQIPSIGAEAGKLTTDAWTCTYRGASVFVSASHVVLSSSALRVSPTGSFTFSAVVPAMGPVSVVGWANEHEATAAPITRVTGPAPDGYRPQGYTLVSPTRGLTTYGLDPTLALAAGRTGNGAPPTLIAASVKGEAQYELIGTVWRGPTSGEWDFDTC